MPGSFRSFFLFLLFSLSVYLPWHSSKDTQLFSLLYKHIWAYKETQTQCPISLAFIDFCPVFWQNGELDNWRWTASVLCVWTTLGEHEPTTFESDNTEKYSRITAHISCVGARKYSFLWFINSSLQSEHIQNCDCLREETTCSRGVHHGSILSTRRA